MESALEVEAEESEEEGPSLLELDVSLDDSGSDGEELLLELL